MLRRFALPLVAALLLAAHASAAPRPGLGAGALEVRAEIVAPGVVRVSWVAPRGAALACVLRGTLLVGCAGPGEATVQQGPGSVDAAARLAAGDVLEVRAWDADGELLAAGWAVVGVRVALPLLAAPGAAAGPPGTRVALPLVAAP